MNANVVQYVVKYRTIEEARENVPPHEKVMTWEKAQEFQREHQNKMDMIVEIKVREVCMEV